MSRHYGILSRPASLGHYPFLHVAVPSSSSSAVQQDQASKINKQEVSCLASQVMLHGTCSVRVNETGHAQRLHVLKQSLRKRFFYLRRSFAFFFFFIVGIRLNRNKAL